jgi:hypothetical protein
MHVASLFYCSICNGVSVDQASRVVSTRIERSSTMKGAYCNHIIDAIVDFDFVESAVTQRGSLARVAIASRIKKTGPRLTRFVLRFKA